MVTLTIACEVPPNRRVTLTLPKTVAPGRHELLVVVGDPERTIEESNAEALMRFAGRIDAFREVDGLEYQRRIRAEWDR